MQLTLYKILALTTGGTPSGSSGGSIRLTNPLGVTSIADLINRITDYLVIIGAPIATVMIIWAAFQILTASGDPEKVTKGRKTITYAVIGYAIILAARGLALVIKNVLGA